jgi:hypothetical protein
MRVKSFEIWLNRIVAAKAYDQQPTRAVTSDHMLCLGVGKARFWHPAVEEIVYLGSYKKPTFGYLREDATDDAL